MTKLRQAMIDAMLVRGFAARTHESYLYAVTDLAKYYHRSPEQLNTGQIQAYFLYLVKERHLAPASCRLSLNGIRFLYLDLHSALLNDNFFELIIHEYHMVTVYFPRLD